MRKKIAHLLLPLFASLSLSVSAAPAPASQAVQPVAVASETRQADTRLDLNKADAASLQAELNGIGKSKAEAIVAYREANGPFTSVDEMLEVKGIGSALLERNRDKLTVELSSHRVGSRRSPPAANADLGQRSRASLASISAFRSRTFFNCSSVKGSFFAVSRNIISPPTIEPMATSKINQAYQGMMFLP